MRKGAIAVLVFTILVVTAWLVSQRSEIRKLESRSNELRQKIELIEERGGLADARGRSDQNGLKPWQEADDGGAFDWKRFAELVRPNSPAHGVSFPVNGAISN